MFVTQKNGENSGVCHLTQLKISDTSRASQICQMWNLSQMLHQLMINDSHENSDPSTPDIPERELACILTAQNSLMTLIKKAEHECIFLANFVADSIQLKQYIISLLILINLFYFQVN